MSCRSAALSRSVFAMDAIHEAESELAHDYCDDRQHDADWWRERRPLYVALYRRVAQLDRQMHRSVRTFISVPPVWAAEQEQVESEGRAEAQLQPHLRWSKVDWRDLGSELLASRTWPPPMFTAALAKAERAVHSSIGCPGAFLLDQGKWRPRFAIGDRVLARVEFPGSPEEWWPGTVVWRLYPEVCSCEGEEARSAAAVMIQRRWRQGRLGWEH